MSEQEYIPEQGQLCYTLTDYYDVFPIKNTIETLIAEPIQKGDVVLITKANYYKETSSYYVEFIRDRKLFYTYFYEQVMYFNQCNNEILTMKNPITTFNFPWMIYE
jgi:hypothetical protein